MSAAAPNSVERMAKIFHPFGYREGLTLVLAAYVDASDENPDIPVASVAGVLGTTERWLEFEPKWKAFLDEHGLARFHATQYWARTGQYKRWEDDRFPLARKQIRDILAQNRLMAVAFAVSTKAFDEWRGAQRQFYPADPYYFCLDRVLRQLIIGVHEVPKDEGITIYVDRDKGRERLAKEVAEWHEDRLRRLPPIGAVNPYREIRVMYGGSSFDYKPLQLADIISNGAYRTCAKVLKDGPSQMWLNESFVASPVISFKMFMTAEEIEADIRSTLIVGENA